MPFIFGFGIFNDTEARSIHLTFAVFLAFVAFPAFKRSSRTVVPLSDWVLALIGAFCASYLFLFYNAIAARPGQPTTLDIVVGLTGVAIMLEATRRAMGFGMLITTGLFLLYVFAGPYMPDVIQHKGASVSRFVSHFWLTTEGVYGVALGVSVQFIFLFVLFGTLLDLAGAGNYMLQVSLALLGHLRGGPAKVAVVSSALNGMVSGSSVSNVVSGGIFTIPLMRRTGYSAVKAGAIEAASSINGQIMPPVMGAAAFLMVEYVGIPYSEIIKHAVLPAVISYIALFYIVHLEALKYDLQPIPRGYEITWREANRSAGASACPGRSSRSAPCTSSSRRCATCSARTPAGRSVRSRSPRTSCCSDIRRAIPTSPVDEPGAHDLPPAAAVADRARGSALLHSHRRAALVPDGRGALAGDLGLLGDGDHDGAGDRPARDAFLDARDPCDRRRRARRVSRRCGRASCSARAT